MSDYYSVPGIGELYDHIRLYGARADVPFYIEAAKRSGGPVLELACGTGRVLLPTAQAGVAITGLDRSSEMLARCREKLAAEPADVRGRVGLVEGDMRSFDLGRSFSLVTVPFRGFQHLVTIDDQLACLSSVRRHLAPGGRLIFDLFNPHFKYLVADRTEEKEDTPSTRLPDGRSLRRTSRVTFVDFIAQTSDVELIWYVADAAGREERRVQPFQMRWFMRAEIEHLLERAGLRVVDIVGGFDMHPLTNESPEIVVIAQASPQR
jgi:SAM-dependent methyltransferase